MKYSRNRRRKPWGRNPDTEAARLRRQFRAVLRQTERASAPHRLHRWAVMSVWVAGGAFALVLGLVLFVPPPQITAPARAGEIIGQATVTDGDTIEIHGERIRFFGIDAPEAAQLCELDGERYRCGQTSAFVLSDRIGRQTVTCEKRDVDQYDRIVAVCTVGAEHLNAFMVRNGWALAYREYSRDYVDEEAAAKAEGLGLWRGTFTPPWEWRHRKRSAAKTSEPAPGGCRIKGNISGSGKRIYHVPGDDWYDETRIDPAKGERWFCSEAEARTAGWRRAKQ